MNYNCIRHFRDVIFSSGDISSYLPAPDHVTLFYASPVHAADVNVPVSARTVDIRCPQIQETAGWRGFTRKRTRGWEGVCMCFVK
ncbi:hypothetical protein BgiMline_019089 [Biomphalaria glabrata]|nr:hypothetical protein BgiMline_006678 [Biomphalaria glabrata]